LALEVPDTHPQRRSPVSAWGLVARQRNDLPPPFTSRTTRPARSRRRGRASGSIKLSACRRYGWRGTANPRPMAVGAGECAARPERTHLGERLVLQPTGLLRLQHTRGRLKVWPFTPAPQPPADRRPGQHQSGTLLSPRDEHHCPATDRPLCARAPRLPRRHEERKIDMTQRRQVQGGLPV